MIGLSSVFVFAAGCFAGYYFGSGKFNSRSKMQRHREWTDETRSRKNPVREAERRQGAEPPDRKHPVVGSGASNAEPLQFDKALLPRTVPIVSSDFKGEELPSLSTGEASPRETTKTDMPEPINDSTGVSLPGSPAEKECPGVTTVTEEEQRPEPSPQENKAVVALLDSISNVLTSADKKNAEDWLYVVKELKGIGDNLDPVRYSCYDEHDAIVRALKRIGGLLEELDAFSLKDDADKETLSEAARSLREIVLQNGGCEMPVPESYDGILHKNVLGVFTPMGAPIKEIVSNGLLLDGEVLKRAYVKA